MHSNSSINIWNNFENISKNKQKRYFNIHKLTGDNPVGEIEKRRTKINEF